MVAKLCVEASRKSDACKLPAGLYLVATPIGHLGDITLRALTVLAQADVIACEDTRNSGLLLKAFGIKAKTMSCHDHNEKARSAEILQRIARGEAVALISDAGMPAIADPGFKLVRACRDAGVAVVVIPGANAALTALSSCGLPTDHFYFAGFLPAKSAARKKELAAFKPSAATLIVYESPQRLGDTLSDMAEILGAARPACVARELTKFYEEIRRGTLRELAAHYAAHQAKGEIVLVVGKSQETETHDLDALLRQRLKNLSLRDAVSEIAAMTGAPKKQVYIRALELSEKK